MCNYMYIYIYIPMIFPFYSNPIPIVKSLPMNLKGLRTFSGSPQVFVLPVLAWILRTWAPYRSRRHAMKKLPQEGLILIQFAIFGDYDDNDDPWEAVFNQLV